MTCWTHGDKLVRPKASLQVRHSCVSYAVRLQVFLIRPRYSFICAIACLGVDSLIASVEIIGRGGTVQRVFFPIPEVSYFSVVMVLVLCFHGFLLLSNICDGIRPYDALSQRDFMQYVKTFWPYPETQKAKVSAIPTFYN